MTLFYFKEKKDSKKFVKVEMLLLNKNNMNGHKIF